TERRDRRRRVRAKISTRSARRRPPASMAVSFLLSGLDSTTVRPLATMSIPSSPGVRVAARAPVFLGRRFDRAHRNSEVTDASRGSGGRAVIGGLRGPKRAEERQRGGSPSRATGCGSDEGDAAGEDRGGPPDGR